MPEKTWKERRQARRVQRLRDAYDDYWHWLWGARFAMSPSQYRKAEERLAKLEARLDAALDREGK